MPISQNISNLYISIGKQLQKLDIDQSIEYIRKADRISPKLKREAIDTLRALRILTKTTLANSQNQSESTHKLINAVSKKLSSTRMQKLFSQLGQADLVNQLMELNQASADNTQKYKNRLIQYKVILDNYKKYLFEDGRVIKKQMNELEHHLKSGLSSKPERLDSQLFEISRRLHYYKEALTAKLKNSQDVFRSLKEDHENHSHLFTKLEVAIGTSDDSEIASQLPIVKQQRAKLDHEYNSICRNKKHFHDEIKQLNADIESMEKNIEVIALKNKVDKQVNKGIFKVLKKKLMQSDTFQQFKSQMDKEGKIDTHGLKLLRQMQNSSNLAELRNITGKLNGGLKSGTNQSVLSNLLTQVFAGNNSLAQQCQQIDQHLNELVDDESLKLENKPSKNI